MATIFPGIDPFLEAQGYWPDFHVTFLTQLRDAIGDLLPDRYMVRIEERIYLVDRDLEDVRLIRPDLPIEKSPGRADFRQAGVALEVEPMTIPFQLHLHEEIRERHIEITHRPDRTLVTVIELLSPDNKSGSGLSQYQAKRAALLGSPAHLIELDFLIGGKRLPMRRPLPPGEAYAIVARGDRRPDCEVYAWSIRQALSPIRLPLLAPDPDLRLDLGTIYATAFERGRYARSIDYTAPLTLPMAPEDRAWAEARARASR